MNEEKIAQRVNILYLSPAQSGDLSMILPLQFLPLGSFPFFEKVE